MPPSPLLTLPSELLTHIITHLTPTSHPTAHLSIPLSRPYTPYYALPPRSADLLSLSLTSKRLHTLTKTPLRAEREREQGDLHEAQEAVTRLLMYGVGDRQTAVGWLRAWQEDHAEEAMRKKRAWVEGWRGKVGGWG